eukprot:comp22480_c0_seq1/m.55644 comp22480_c0_seq1/g.55644  ORF comp22480_c0_seq1/g.55644 comp22480_c0_seq1/m.55644 type:complete len:551 (-) comp22480_c0_seq1:807-2459(-)
MLAVENNERLWVLEHRNLDLDIRRIAGFGLASRLGVAHQRIDNDHDRENNRDRDHDHKGNRNRRLQGNNTLKHAVSLQKVHIDRNQRSNGQHGLDQIRQPVNKRPEHDNVDELQPKHNDAHRHLVVDVGAQIRLARRHDTRNREFCGPRIWMVGIVELVQKVVPLHESLIFVQFVAIRRLAQPDEEHHGEPNRVHRHQQRAQHRQRQVVRRLVAHLVRQRDHVVVAARLVAAHRLKQLRRDRLVRKHKPDHNSPHKPVGPVSPPLLVLCKQSRYQHKHPQRHKHHHIVHKRRCKLRRIRNTPQAVRLHKAVVPAEHVQDRVHRHHPLRQALVRRLTQARQHLQRPHCHHTVRKRHPVADQHPSKPKQRPQDAVRYNVDHNARRLGTQLTRIVGAEVPVRTLPANLALVPRRTLHIARAQTRLLRRALGHKPRVLAVVPVPRLGPDAVPAGAISSLGAVLAVGSTAILALKGAVVREEHALFASGVLVVDIGHTQIGISRAIGPRRRQMHRIHLARGEPGQELQCCKLSHISTTISTVVSLRLAQVVKSAV